MSAAATSLSTTVNAPLPAEFANLPEDDLARLDSLVRAAVTARAESMDRAIKGSLKHAPKLARPAIRKVLGL
ncbi:hypothetical protein GOEFS_010_00100 [Gordonia effusa NBRC 100432]|uniref:Uncharacterized protein n=1 Tax=Gordonia effusa NBRC 100432 TaxID=1077974 RepID=H0QV46_9ACTN|nr:hypothetical protein [Gordonia effusa]GAB16697.1 hypothetical protein GOEFS_010_00100 [Gordonia effusa NBRC 100432]